MILTSLMQFIRQNGDFLNEVEDKMTSLDISGSLVDKIMSKFLRNLPISVDLNVLFLKNLMRSVLLDEMRVYNASVEINSTHGPHIILICGINGTGKSSSSVKICNTLHALGWRTGVLLLDDYKIGSDDQFLEYLNPEIKVLNDVRKERQLSSILKSKKLSKNIDAIVIDTGGRVGLNLDLMMELKRVKTYIAEVYKGSLMEVLFPLDVTSGFQTFENLDIFNKIIDVDGIIATKADLNPHSGIILSACHRFSLPVYGISSSSDDNQIASFDPESFVDNLMISLNEVIEKYRDRIF